MPAEVGQRGINTLALWVPAVKWIHQDVSPGKNCSGSVSIPSEPRCPLSLEMSQFVAMECTLPEP